MIKKQKISNYGNRYKRMVYSFEFPNRYVYVGLTYNMTKRKAQHLSPHNKSYVYKHMIKTHTKPKLKKLTDYIDAEKAKQLEGIFLLNYSKKNWHILNKAKTGALGGNIVKHTKTACINDAKKYKSRREWYEKSASSYDAARRNKWLNECCVHMCPLKNPNGYWTKERCVKDAKKYLTKSEWQYKSKTSYGISSKNKWLNECCVHMKLMHKKNGYWTKERCAEDAKNYSTRNDWRINSSSASTIASKNGWLNECCTHMINCRKLKYDVL